MASLEPCQSAHSAASCRLEVSRASLVRGQSFLNGVSSYVMYQPVHVGLRKYCPSFRKSSTVCISLFDSRPTNSKSWVSSAWSVVAVAPPTQIYSLGFKHPEPKPSPHNYTGMFESQLPKSSLRLGTHLLWGNSASIEYRSHEVYRKV